MQPPPPRRSPAGPPPAGPPPRLPVSGGADPPPPSSLRGPIKGSCGPVGGGGDMMRRAPKFVEFYKSLMKRGEARQTTSSSGPKASGKSKVAPSDLIGEITRNSPPSHSRTSQRGDPGGLVQTVATEVREATFTNIEDVAAFVAWLDEELSFLVDEQAVLKLFNWPKKRADTLWEAAAKYQGLLQLEKQILSFVALYRDAALRKMYSLFEKKKSIYRFLQDRDAADTKNNLISRYKEQDNPVGWMLDTGLLLKIKLACVNPAKQYIMRVVSEIDSLRSTGQEQSREQVSQRAGVEQSRSILMK